MATLTQAPSEPTNGDVMIAIETLRNAGAVVDQTTRFGVSLITIKLVVGD